MKLQNNIIYVTVQQWKSYQYTELLRDKFMIYFILL